MIHKRWYSIIGIGTGFLLLAWIYRTFNPAEHFFLPCPIKHATGLECPTCGSQRALHELLNGHIEEAFRLNPLIFLLTPYFLLWIYFRLKTDHSKKEAKLYSTLFGTKAITVIIAVTAIFTVWRNIK